MPGGGESRRDEGGDDSTGDGRLRQVVLVATLLALAYLAWRRLGTGIPGSRSDEAPTGGAPDEAGHPVSIDGPTDEGTAVDEPAPPAAAVDPSLEEVDERTDEDVEGTPTEPGEMAVSEDVAEEAGEAPGDEGESEEVAGGSAAGADEGSEE